LTVLEENGRKSGREKIRRETVVRTLAEKFFRDFEPGRIILPRQTDKGCISPG
jgi:hypothetical protein